MERRPVIQDCYAVLEPDEYALKTQDPGWMLFSMDAMALKIITTMAEARNRGDLSSMGGQSVRNEQGSPLSQGFERASKYSQGKKLLTIERADPTMALVSQIHLRERRRA
jgi:hypothetical protein